MGEEANSGGVMMYGTWNGIPIYIDQHMERDRVLTMKKTDSKPNRETRVKEPRTKGLDHENITAFIVHPSIADKIKEFI